MKIRSYPSSLPQAMMPAVLIGEAQQALRPLLALEVAEHALGQVFANVQAFALEPPLPMMKTNRPSR